MSYDTGKTGALDTGEAWSIPPFPEPTIVAVCDGIPVHAFGYTHVLGASPADIRIPGRVQRVSGYDCLNGVEQDVMTQADGNETVVRGIYVRDYPILVRFEEAQK